MRYCSILVHVDSSISARRRVAAAAELALRFGYQLTGAFLSSSRLPNYVVSDGITPISGDIVDGYAKQRKDEIAVGR